MYTIHKFPLQIRPIQIIEVPQGAEFLSVHNQDELIAVWFRCDPSKPTEYRTMLIIMTGSAAPPPEQSRFIGTVLLDHGTFVAHIFEGM